MNASHVRVQPRHERLNIVVLLLQTVAWVTLLSLLDRHLHPVLDVAVLAVFCAVMQGVFSLMHEGFHDLVHGSRRVGHLMGWWASTMFGCAFTLHRVNHKGHHVRNRTRAEQGEFIHPDENPVKKTAVYYFAILGGLWLGSFAFSVLVFVIPHGTLKLLARTRRVNTYAAAFDHFTREDWNRMRLESAAAIAAWAGVVWLTGWHWQTLLLAYGVFAFTWSSLQWIYHLHTPLDVIEGAYNLRLPLPLRLSFLNFNYNLTHHRSPSTPWQELCAVSNQRETQPLWYRWLLGLRPPVRFPDDTSGLEKTYF